MSGGISGGHINPVSPRVWLIILQTAFLKFFALFAQVVTLSLAVFRDFPWKKVPAYIFAQFLGAWIGAMLVFADYFHAIDISLGRTTPGTASLFATYAVSDSYRRRLHRVLTAWKYFFLTARLRSLRQRFLRPGAFQSPSSPPSPLSGDIDDIRPTVIPSLRVRMAH